MAGGGVKRKGGEVEAQSLRRLVRCATIKKESAKEQAEILELKREAMALMKRTATEEAQPAAGNKRKKVIKTPLPRALIESMILNPHKPLDGFREEELPKRSQKFREFYAREKAISDKILEYEQALIKQFRKKGYAVNYKEVEVTDDDEN